MIDRYEYIYIYIYRERERERELCTKLQKDNPVLLLGVKAQRKALDDKIAERQAKLHALDELLSPHAVQTTAVTIPRGTAMVG